MFHTKGVHCYFFFMHILSAKKYCMIVIFCPTTVWIQHIYVYNIVAWLGMTKLDGHD